MEYALWLVIIFGTINGYNMNIKIIKIPADTIEAMDKAFVRLEDKDVPLISFIQG
jgi:hypothetical protein